MVFVPRHQQFRCALKGAKEMPKALPRNAFQNFSQFAERNVFQSLAFAIQVLVQLNSGLLHLGVRVCRPTYQDEILAPGKPFVTIFIVQPHS